MKKHKTLLAHYDKDNPKKSQLLLEHLLNVANQSKLLGSIVGLDNSCQLIGLLHDFGKSDYKFQCYIRGEYTGRVDHSSAGGVALQYIGNQVYEEYKIEELLGLEGLKKNIWSLYNEILTYPILAHHGLYDIIDSNLEYRTGKRINSRKMIKENSISKDLEFLNLLNKEYIRLNNKSVCDLYYEGFKEFIKIYKSLKAITSKINSASNRNGKIRRNKVLCFYYGALVRLLLSILKDADIYDSSNYYRDNKDKTYYQQELNSIWSNMSQSIENLYDTFNKNPNKSDLDIVRTNLANNIYDFSQKYDKGAFKLDMPVGAGKTYAGIRYAVNNAKQFQKSRVFYCTAFLSVLEQNAFSIKEVLGNEHILEHHSNIIQDFEGNEENEDQRDYEVYEYLKESWESPVILTTLVQFSNTLFKHKSSNIRRFSKLINSVIIIDEIQSLPTKAIYNFNLMTNFLTHIMNCTIVHSTATSPNLDNKEALKYPCNYGYGSDEFSIIKLEGESKVFSRVNYYSLLGENLDKYYNNKEITEHIKLQLREELSILIVLNTKTAVANLYKYLSEDTELIEEDVEIIYLTTNQCPQHRLQIINNTKNRLKKLRNFEDTRRIICISTKLVEAGVDIDFDIVYRSLAGIDSVIQCGGRCNREGKKIDRGKLFVFKCEDENLRYLADIRKQREAAETALKVVFNEEIKDVRINIEKASDYYFHKLYLNEEAQGKYLEYPLDDGETILNLLTNNPKGVENYIAKQGERPYFKLRQSFKTAAMEFDLIKENTISIIVQYKNEEIIERLYEAIECNDYYNVKKELRNLQPYAISIRRAAEYENYITKELDGEILILSKEAYDEKIGLTKGELQSLIF